MPNNQTKLDLIFQALADRNRRFVIQRLCRGSATVSELGELVPMTLPSLLQHLDGLERCGLIWSEKKGRVRTCWLQQDALSIGARWIEERQKSARRHAREGWA